MEPDGSLDTASVIRVVVLQVGEISASAFRAFSSVVTRHRVVPLARARRFYRELQKSPFTHEPWEAGALKFKFILGGASRSPWEDFQAQRRIHGVIGVCHGPRCPDLSAALDEFSSASKTYPGAQVRRCFVFEPTDAQCLEHEAHREQRPTSELILLAPGTVAGSLEEKAAGAADGEGGSAGGGEDGEDPPESHDSPPALVAAVMEDFAAAVLMALESWVLHADPVGSLMSTPLDPPAAPNEDPAKAKKKRLARLQKAIGDFCLLAGSPEDAHSHYQTALDMSKVGSDLLWLAGALEGSVAATVAQSYPSADVEKEVTAKYADIIQLYRKANATIFELEAVVKVARYICRRQAAKEVCDLLGSAVETGRALQNPSDRLVLFIEVGRIFAQLGYERKAAFFAREVAQLYEQQESRFAAISAMQVLSLTAPTYKVESNATEHQGPGAPTEQQQQQQQPSRGEKGGLKGGKGSSSGRRSRSRGSFKLRDEMERTGEWTGGQWSSLQLEVLNDMLSMAVRAGDALAAWSAAARMLQGFHPLLPRDSQVAAALALYSAGQRLPPGTRCADPCLPFVRFGGFSPGPENTQIMQRGAQGWRDASRAVAASGPFIYTPFSRSTTVDRQSTQWVANELVQVTVQVANPTAVELHISALSLSIEGVPFDPFPVSVALPPYDPPRSVVLSGMPRAPGKAVARGCFVTCFGVTTENLFRTNPDARLHTRGSAPGSNPFAAMPDIDPETLVVPVLPELPLLLPMLPENSSCPLVFEGETREVKIQLANNGSVPVVDVMVYVSKKPKDQEMLVDQEQLLKVLPLAPGASATVTVTVLARCVAADAKPDEAGIEIVAQYAGPVPEDTGEECLPPGRRLTVPIQLRVLKGLEVLKAQFLVTGGNSEGAPASLPRMKHAPQAHAGDRAAAAGNSCNEDAFLGLGLPEMGLRVRTGDRGQQDGAAQGRALGGGSARMEVPVRPEGALRLLGLELWNDTDAGFNVSVSLLPRAVADQAIRAAQKEKAAMGKAVKSAPDLSKLEAPDAGEGAPSELHGLQGAEQEQEQEQLLCSCHVSVGSAHHLLIPLSPFDLHHHAEAALALLQDDEDGEAAVRRQLALRGLGPTLTPFEILLTALCSRLRVRWVSDLGSQGELPVREAVKRVVESPAISALLKDPLAFAFHISAKSLVGSGAAGAVAPSPVQEGALSSRPRPVLQGLTATKDMTGVAMSVRNTSHDLLALSLSLTCLDMAGEPCIGDWSQSPRATSVLCEGTLSCIEVILEPGQEFTHRFSLCFLVPGDYVLLAAAVVDTLPPGSAGAAAPGADKQHNSKTVCCTSMPFLVTVVAGNEN